MLNIVNLENFIHILILLTLSSEIKMETKISFSLNYSKFLKWVKFCAKLKKKKNTEGLKEG